MRQAKEAKPGNRVSKKRGIGITIKLAAAVVTSAIIDVSALMAVVYDRMFQTLLEKSEEILHTTIDKTLQETKAWMNKTLTMLETQRDTIEYEDMNIPEMLDYIKHTAGRMTLIRHCISDEYSCTECGSRGGPGRRCRKRFCSSS